MPINHQVARLSKPEAGLTAVAVAVATGTIAATVVAAVRFEYYILRARALGTITRAKIALIVLVHG